MLTVLLWVGSLLTGQVEASAKPDMADLAKKLVRQLDAEELAQRDAAEQALLALGPDVADLLPPVTDRTPAEVAQRLTRIVHSLQEGQAKAAAAPSLITLDAKGLPLADVLAAIAKQSGNKIVDHRADFGEEVSEPKLTVAFSKTPFWEALDEVMDQAELSVYNYAGESGIFLVNRHPGQSARKATASYNGPFRIQPTRFESIRDLENPANKSLRLMMDVAWEPRLSPILIHQPLDKIEAIGDDQQPIAVSGAEGDPEAEIGAEVSAVELQIPLELPPRKIEKIALLKGQLRTLMVGQMKTFRFEQLPIAKDGQAKKIEQKQAGVAVILDQVRKNNDVWEVQVRVRFDEPSQALESHRTWIFNNEAFFVTGDKKPILAGAYEQTRQTEDEVGIKYLFDLKKGPQGMAFVYKTPVAILEVPIEYELKDLDLP